jgi:tetratricopeptide (TPR) repeat protein
MNNSFRLLILVLVFFACETDRVVSQVAAHSPTYISSFHEGVRHKLNGEITQAISKFTTCLNDDQNDDAVHFALYQIYSEKIQLQLALIHIKSALKIDPSNKHYKIELANNYSAMGEYEKSALLFEELINNDLKNLVIYEQAVDNWRKANKIKKAIAVLNKLEYNIGIDPQILLQKAALFEMIEDNNSALSQLLLANKQFPGDSYVLNTLLDFYMSRGNDSDGILVLKELLNADPSDGYALILLAEIQYSNGEINEALTNFKKAIKEEGLTIDQRMEILIRLQKEKDINLIELSELIDFMVNAYPKEAKAHAIKGDHYFKLNQPLIAIESYKDAVNCDPNLYQIWTQIISLEYENEQWDSLFLDSEKSLAYFPTQPLVYFLCGVAANKLLLFDKAKECLSAGLDFLVNDVSLEAEINSQLGISYFGLKQNELGFQKFEKSLQLAPRNNIMIQTFAIQLARNQIDFPKANKLVDNLLLLDSGDAKSLSFKGRVLFYEKKYSEALDTLLRALKLLENDSVINDYLGDTYYFLGQISKATDFWLKAKLLGSKNNYLERKINTKTYHEALY